MKISKLFAVVAVFVVTPATQVFAADAQSGKALYDKQCVACHAADGKGNPAMIKALGEKGLNIVGKETVKKSDADLLKVIVEGAGKMPAAKSLSAQEQKQVLSYTRSLAK
jgi:mono/diheme cytochrome c family protein